MLIQRADIKFRIIRKKLPRGDSDRNPIVILMKTRSRTGWRWEIITAKGHALRIYGGNKIIQSATKLPPTPIFKRELSRRKYPSYEVLINVLCVSNGPGDLSRERNFAGRF